MYRADRETVFEGVRELLAYYRIPDVSLPPELSGEGLAGYLNGNTPLILVPVVLEENWYRGLSCPLLTWDQEGLCRAVFPGGLGRAWFRSAGSGRRVAVTKGNEGQFRRECYAVQRDLPGKTPTLRGALRRLLAGMGGPELGFFLLWSLLGGVFLALLSMLVRSMMTDAVLRSELSAVRGYFLGLAGLTLAGLVMLYIGRRMALRMSRRGGLGLLPALGARLWLSVEHREHAAQAAMLASLREDGERLCRWALTLLWGAGMLPSAAAALRGVSPRMAEAALGSALILTLAGIAVAWPRRETPVEDRERYRWLEGRGGDKRFGVERPFPFARRAPSQENGRPGWALPLLLSPMLLAGAGEKPTDLICGMMLALPVIAAPALLLSLGPGTGEALSRLRKLLLQAESRRRHQQELPDMDSPLELKTVTFTYPGRREPVLREVELLVTPGEVVGILGGTGAGKTTLARLMTGLLEPDCGMVYYGGTELRRYEPEFIRSRIALENGADIRLLDRAPERLDGRTTVIFSTREEDMACCGRIYELADGRLLERNIIR